MPTKSFPESKSAFATKSFHQKWAAYLEEYPLALLMWDHRIEKRIFWSAVLA